MSLAADGCSFHRLPSDERFNPACQWSTRVGSPLATSSPAGPAALQSSPSPPGLPRAADLNAAARPSEAEGFSIMPAHHAKRPLLVVANARHSQAMAALCA